MIPYALFLFRIVTEEGILDISAQEVMQNGFRFSLPQKSEALVTKAQKYLACFLLPGAKQYKEYEVSGIVRKDETGYLFVSGDRRFLDDFRLVQREYLRIIRIKSDGDEFTAMEELAGLSVSEEFFENPDAWRAALLRPQSDVRPKNGNKTAAKEIAEDEAALKPVEIAICIDCGAYAERFLAMEFSEFVTFYLTDNHLTKYAVAREKITHIYLGNLYCADALPNKESILLLSERVAEIGLTPVVCLAPMREDKTDEYRTFLTALGALAKEQETKTEIVIGDYGVPMLLKELEKEGRIEPQSFAITASPLINKRKKDPRTKLLKQKGHIYEGNAANLFSDAGLTELLRERLGIEAVSYEVCGYAIDFGSLPFILHMPRYQITTSQCVLKNLCLSGDRGIGGCTACAHFCEKYFITYPKNLGMCGIGGSVFGLSDTELKDMAYLNELTGKGLKRIVLRA